MQVSHGLLPMDSESWKQQESITMVRSDLQKMVVIMAIKYADTIINEIKERGSIITSETSVNGEEFEKWLYAEETANVAPVLLPAMNINEYFRRKYEKNGQ